LETGVSRIFFLHPLLY